MKKKPKKIKKVCREEAEWRVDKRTKENRRTHFYVREMRHQAEVNNGGSAMGPHNKMELKPNTIYNGDTLETLKTFPDESVDCVVTSPPYYGLRDYGVAGQIGLEKTPEEYVAKMVEVFREARRVLKEEGTLWLNLGDTYSAQRWSGGGGQPMNKNRDTHRSGNHAKNSGLPDKNLIGIPWHVAFALQADGWYLRQDIIWHKPNPMPESVTDRCTKAHEYIFLLSKSAKYYFDNEAIKEPLLYPNATKSTFGSLGGTGKKGLQYSGKDYIPPNGRNKRSVWTVTTKPYKGAHFATFPPDLIEPMIKAGCPQEVCSKCGKAKERVLKKERFKRNELPEDDPRYRPNTYHGSYEGINGKGDAGYTQTETIGWTDCGCGGDFVSGIVLDPFMGSGTTAYVARSLGRNYVGIELNPSYITLADKRLEQQVLI